MYIVYIHTQIYIYIRLCWTLTEVCLPILHSLLFLLNQHLLLFLLLLLICIALASRHCCVDLSLTTSPSDPEPSDVLLFSGDHRCYYSKGQLH